MQLLEVATIKVRFRDVDSMGHVNNAVYASYLETARVEFYEQVFGPDGFDRFPFILAELQIRFVSPATMSQRLDLRVGVSEVGGKSFKFSYEIVEKASGRIVCEAQSVQVCYDYEAMGTTEIADEWRRTIEGLRTKGLDQ